MNPFTALQNFSPLHFTSLFILFCIKRVLPKQQSVCNICVGQGDSRRIYEACLQTIQTYARCNTGRLSLESAAEEDTFHDILLLMELLTNLLSKDFIDLSPPGELAHSLLEVFILLINFIPIH